MITTVTLNPCIDKTITINGFNYGGMNRAIGVRADVCGKGINVSIAVHQLGEDTECMGFNYTEGGAALAARLEKYEIKHEFVNVEGTLRTNVKVFESENRVMTEFNESGYFVDEASIDRLKESVLNHAGSSDIMVFTGSIPKGVPKDIYRTLIESAKEKGVKTVLDAEGDMLIEGLKAAPYFIKPNLYELEMTFKVKIQSKEDIVKISREIIKGGVKIVCTTLGKDGAVIVSEDEAWYVPGSDIEVKGVQGAGDSVVAGICIAMRRNLLLSDMLRYGTAAANASLIREGTEMCTLKDFNDMLSRVKMEKI